MIEKDFDIIYNKEYLVIVPKLTEHLFDAFKYSFGNVILMEKGVDEINKIIGFINKNNFKQIIFVDYQGEYNEIILNLNKDHDIKCIFTGSLGALSCETELSTFNGIYNLYEKKLISKIGFLDECFYKVLKAKKENVELICLDREINKSEEINYNKNEIGVLNCEKNPRHSFYNELSAIKLMNKYKAKLINPNKTTKSFLKLFNISSKVIKDNLVGNNVLNLYINFTDNNNLVFIESMDKNVPCILGNTKLLDNYKELKKYLVMKSDDNINEMAERIELVIENRENILKEYKKFREDYTKKSKESIKNFLGEEKEEVINENSSILVTAVVPVYNVEKYIGKCLDSIIAASIDNMEILVINDGSPDNSEEVIKEYVEKYPKLIRYIKQENHGLGNVRNVALKEAKGKYIASIDSDDTININFFKSMEKYLKENIDVVICDWLTVTDETKYDTPASDWIFNSDKWNRYEALLYTSIMPSTCNKVMKKSLFNDLKLKYREDKFEDLSANPFVLMKAKTIKYINKGYYEYYIRSDSIMRTKPGYSMIDVLKEVEEKLEKYKNYLTVSKDDFKYYTYSWRIEEYVINPLYTLEEKELDKYIKYVEKELKDIMIDIFNNKRYKETINLLEEKDKEYINKRNKMFEEGNLSKLIKEVRKSKKYYKITPGLIYYGNK